MLLVENIKAVNVSNSIEIPRVKKLNYTQNKSDTIKNSESPGIPYIVLGSILIATGFFTTLTTDGCPSSSSMSLDSKCNIVGAAGFLQALAGGGLIYLGIRKTF
jgi:hypothetical protein